MSNDQEKVKPTQPGGFRDYLPSEMIVRNRMIATIRSVFERFGFDPLETPGVEREQVLTGGGTTDMIIWRAAPRGSRASKDPGQQTERETALRFDLTVPLARVIAAYPELRRPFKRYQIGNVWRGEKPQAGRFREFMQFDADIVGTATMLADAEIVALMVETLRALGVKRFQVRFNNRKILSALPAYAGFDPAKSSDVLRVIDKLPKIGAAAVLEDLTMKSEQRTERKADAEVEPEIAEARDALGLPQDVAAKIAAFIELQGTTDQLLDATERLMGAVPVATEGVREMRDVVTALRAMRVPEEYWKFDLSIARGLAYYTGPVFETFLLDLPEIGSVFSGGRYDDLVNRFLDASIPATGASVGVDRLFAALTKLGKITLAPTQVEALVTVMDPTLRDEYLAITGELRSAGIRTMLWVGEEKAFKAQLAYAVAQEIPVVIILGGNEKRDGAVTVKEMSAKRQLTVPRANLVAVARGILRNEA